MAPMRDDPDKVAMQEEIGGLNNELAYLRSERQAMKVILNDKLQVLVNGIAQSPQVRDGPLGRDVTALQRLLAATLAALGSEN